MKVGRSMEEGISKPLARIRSNIRTQELTYKAAYWDVIIPSSVVIKQYLLVTLHPIRRSKLVKF
jgi:hypothetical protein